MLWDRRNYGHSVGYMKLSCSRLHGEKRWFNTFTPPILVLDRSMLFLTDKQHKQAHIYIKSMGASNCLAITKKSLWSLGKTDFFEYRYLPRPWHIVQTRNTGKDTICTHRTNIHTLSTVSGHFAAVWFPSFCCVLFLSTIQRSFLIPWSLWIPLYTLSS
jgi:hypothetical protein